MPRFLGIDYGTKRIGLALSDEAFQMAFPLETISGDWKSFKARLEELIDAEDISGIVIGLPLGLKNQETDSAVSARAFAKKIEMQFGLPVFFENEVFSTAQVIRENSSPRAKRDASAAALILKSYLERLRRSTAESQ